ncbi:MAG TPA: glycosyltransferase family 2 protein [Puia sp.]|nr:glycosyltransferase family 2 protein [Puia sp.]
MKPPKVSVITVVYNGAATLEATLLSVVEQSYPHVEYILVDGGSTDGTLEIIDRYKTRITAWVSERDKGVYDAMNKGVRMATGDWVYFLGSDDRLQDKAVLSDIFTDPANLDSDLLYGDVTSPSYKGLYDGPFTFGKLLSRNISHQAIFYKRHLFEFIGGYEPRFRMHADWDLNIRWFKTPGIRMKYVDRHIADFGAEGLSSGHDVALIREVLIPERLRWLGQQGQKKLHSLQLYDEWWRMLRNAGIRDLASLEAVAGGEEIPKAVKSMLAWQRKLPPALLRKGAFSKSMMIINYISNL